MRVLLLVAALFAIVGIQHGYAEEKITICHANERENGNSDKPPFEEITIAPQAVIAAHFDHQWGEDVIPQFEYDGVVYGPQGDQSLLDTGCGAATPTNTPESPTETPTNTPTTTPTNTNTPTDTDTPTSTPTLDNTPMSTEPSAPTSTPTSTATPDNTLAGTSEASPTEDVAIAGVSLPDAGTGTTQQPIPTEALYVVPLAFLLLALSRFVVKI
jgi:hypothetical protein